MGNQGLGNRNQEVERNNDTGTGRLKLEIETRNHFIEFVSFICFITLTFLTASINNMTPNLMNGQCSIRKFDTLLCQHQKVHQNMIVVLL